MHILNILKYNSDDVVEELQMHDRISVLLTVFGTHSWKHRKYYSQYGNNRRHLFYTLHDRLATI